MAGAPIAEAFVRIRPVTTGFQAEAEGAVRPALSGLQKLVTGALAFTGVAVGIKDIVNAATQQQAAFAVLDNVIKNAGVSNRLYGQSIDVLLEKQAKLRGFSAEDLAQSFVRLVSVTHDSQKAFHDLGLAEDIARARHVDLATAALALSKEEQGSATALTRIGIIVPHVTTQFDALKTKYAELAAAGVKLTAQQKQDEATALAAAKAADKHATSLAGLALVQSRFGGSAATFANTAQGQIDRAGASLRQFEVQLGGALLPGIAAAAQGVAHLADTLASSTTVQHDASAVAHELGVGLHDLKVAADFVAPPLEAIARAATTVVGAIGPGPLLAAAAAYKAIGIATSLAGTAQAAYTALVSAGRAELAGSAAENVAGNAAVTASDAGVTTASAITAESVTALTVAINANTAAMAANTTEAAAETAIYGPLGGVLATVATEAGGAAVAFEALAGAQGTAAAGAASFAASEGAAVAGTGALEVATAGAAVEAGGFSLALLGITSAINPVTLGVAALAGGLVWFSQAEGTAARAAREFRQALDNLNTGLSQQQAALHDVAGAQSQLTTDRLAVRTAALGVEQSKQAAAQSTAAKGSLEYQVSLNQVAQAQDGLRQAQQRVSADLTSLAAKEHTYRTGLKDTATAVHDATTLFEALKKARTVATTDDPALREVRVMVDGYRNVLTDATLKTEALRQETATFADDIRKAADAMKDHTGAAHTDAEVILQLTQAIGRIPSQAEVNLILHNTDAKASLRDFLTALAALGPEGAKDAAIVGEQIGASLVAGLTNTLLSGGNVFNAINSLFNIPNLPAVTKAGADTAQHFVDSAKAKFNADTSVLAQITAQTQKDAAANALALQQQLEQERTNLGSLASGIASSAGQIIDAETQAQLDTLSGKAFTLASNVAAAVQRGLKPIAVRNTAADIIAPLGAQITMLQSQLDKTTAAGQRQQLLFNIGQATDTASRMNAQHQLYQFDLQQKILTDQKKLTSEQDTIKANADARKKAITENLAAYADEFARGQITLATFSGRVLGTLHKQKSAFGDVGKLLGSAFASNFNEQIQALLDQATAISGGSVASRNTGTSSAKAITPAASLVAATDKLRVEQEQQAREALKVAKEGRDYLKALVTRNLGVPSPSGTSGGPGASAKAREAAKAR